MLQHAATMAASIAQPPFFRHGPDITRNVRFPGARNRTPRTASGRLWRKIAGSIPDRFLSSRPIPDAPASEKLSSD